MEGKPFEVLELSKNFKAELMCLKESLFELQGSHILRFLHLIRENPCQPVLASKKQEFEVLLKCLKQTMTDTGNIFRQQIIQYYLYILACNIFNLLLTNYAPAVLSRSESIFQEFIKECRKILSQGKECRFLCRQAESDPEISFYCDSTTNGKTCNGLD